MLPINTSTPIPLQWWLCSLRQFFKNLTQIATLVSLFLYNTALAVELEQPPAPTPKAFEQNTSEPPNTEQETNFNSPSTFPINTLDAKTRATLDKDPIFKQAEEVFLFGSHAEQAGVLKRLLRHYQIHQKKLEALEAPPAPPQATAVPHTTETSTQTKPSLPVVEPFEASDPPIPQVANSAPQTTPTLETTPALKEKSFSSTHKTPVAHHPPLYTLYYEPVIKPLFQIKNKHEITLVLLDWITTLPLVEQIGFIGKILEHPEEKKKATPLVIQLKNKALRALEELKLDTTQTTTILLSYLNDPKLNLENNVLIESAVAGLAGKGGSEIKKKLKELFETTLNNDIKIAILRSLSQFKATTDVEFFINILDSREVDSVIWTALVELTYYPTSSEAEQTLLTYAHDKDVKLAARAIYALSSFTSDKAYQTLIQATKNNNPLVRSEALKALNKHNRHLADISDILRLLQYKYQHDTDILVKKTAREILEQRGFPLEETP